MKKQLTAIGRGLRALPRLRLRSPSRLAPQIDPENPLHALTDAQLAEAVMRQTADAAARLAILCGDQAPPRGFGVSPLKGPRLRLARTAKESLQASLEGLREVYRRAGRAAS